MSPIAREATGRAAALFGIVQEPARTSHAWRMVLSEFFTVYFFRIVINLKTSLIFAAKRNGANLARMIVASINLREALMLWTETAHTSDGNPVSLRRLLIATSALPAATIALCISFASPVSATPYEYSVVVGATTDLGGGEYSISVSAQPA